MYWPMDDYSINGIFLDTNNIRLPITDTAQDAILQDLFSNEDAFDLAKSIAQYDLFPDEFPILVEEDAKLIVIEGNRRLAALKGLDDPNKVPFFKDRLKGLKNPRIQTIRAVLAPSRDKAVAHIANKHTINLRRPWKPLRQAYFYKSQMDNGKTVETLRTVYPDHDIAKFVRMLQAHHLAKSITYDDDATSYMVHDERRFPITNLERMYEDGYVQEYLGISFDDQGWVKIDTDKEGFTKAYKKLVEDVAHGDIDSRKFNTKNERKVYIDGLPRNLRPATAEGSPYSAGAFKEKKIDRETLEKSFRSNKKHKGLIPSFIPFKLQNSSLKSIYDELRSLPVRSYPNAAHDLLRSFLECALVTYLKDSDELSSINNNNKKHNPKLGEMLNFVQSDKCKSIKDQTLKQVAQHITEDYDHPYSLARFNMLHHNENWSSDENQARAAWNNIEALMKYLLNPQK